MSQKGDAVPALATPAVKGMGKATAALLISLVSIGAFVGAGVGTYVTFRYVILPSFQGSNGNDSNNNKKLHHQLQQWWEHWMHVELSERDLVGVLLVA